MILMMKSDLESVGPIHEHMLWDYSNECSMKMTHEKMFLLVWPTIENKQSLKNKKDKSRNIKEAIHSFNSYLHH